MMDEALRGLLWVHCPESQRLLYFCYPRFFTSLALFLALVLRSWALLLKGGHPFPLSKDWFRAKPVAQYMSVSCKRVSAVGLPGRVFLLDKKETLKGQVTFLCVDRVL